jgi:hypothetical protein
MKWVNLGLVVIALAGATAAPAAEPARGKGSKASKYMKKNDPGEAARKDVLRVKRVFMFAVESCSTNQRCDQQLMRDSEANFMDACKVCADNDKCESDRDAIKSGDGKLGFNPCAAEKASTASK